MRMRKKPNLDARLENCSLLQEKDPTHNRGSWIEAYPGYRAIHLEIGCGKGRFTVEMARENPEVLFVAVERVQSAMVMAMEKALDARLDNIVFLDMDASSLGEIFAPGELDRIYINFCDPWPKSRDAKFRLTAPAFLRIYAGLLKPEGEIWFKTDNLPLFDWSLNIMKAENWEIRELTRDLHESGPVGVMTDYEARFFAEGVKIKRLVAGKTEYTRNTSDGQPPRLRNAALSDARNC